MASGPDLFVVCKSCGREVSPYITECPYCGNRLRKRAPKLERGGKPKPPKAPRRRKPALGRLRPGEIPGIRADGRPYATIALVLAALVVSLGARAGLWSLADLALTSGVTDEYWRTLTTLFAYEQTGYEIVAVGATFLFGWLLERRHGWWAPLLVFLASGAGGMFAAIAAGDAAIATGGNGAALGLLGAWAVRDLLARRRAPHDEDDADMLGVLAIAAVLFLLPLAAEDASLVAGVAGGAIGLALGLVLARVRER